MGATLLCLLMAGCEFPRDADGTLQGVRGGTLRAGAVHAPPWMDTTGGEPAGIDARFVRRIADEFGTRIEWHYGALDELVSLLKERELDILAGGFERDAAARHKTGVSRPYATAHWWVVGEGVSTTTGIDGEIVVVRHGTAATLVRRADGVPRLPAATATADDAALRVVPVTDPAAPPNALLDLGTTDYVLLLPPGETGWVVAVDRVIGQHRREIVRAGERRTGR